MAINHEIFRAGETIPNDRLVVRINCLNERFSAVLIRPNHQPVDYLSVEKAVADAETILRTDLLLGTLAIYDPSHFFADEDFDLDDDDTKMTVFTFFKSISP
ncbi:hypothetical protein [Pararhizobium sp. O133]|uniref:hypothetical protein n=1 Tax=Pararhizobium sp. O133 TaxID=3449278 RepID=UPI003F686F57